MSTATTPRTPRRASEEPTGRTRTGWRRLLPGRRPRAGRDPGGRQDDPGAENLTRTARRTRHAPRHWPWILALVLVGVLLCAAVYAVFFSALLAVRTVAVTGTPDALTAKVRAAVAVADGTPLARVDLDAVAAEVETLPEVSGVEVSRSWPATLTIAVTPRVPVAVTSANGQLWLLDASGDPYLAVGSPPPGLLTVQLVAPGAADPSTAAALTVAEALTPAFRGQVAQLS
ncbi:MAG TPA: FtsQ-type POTRA domain-containing protein, partial [Nakamurella sp.]